MTNNDDFGDDVQETVDRLRDGARNRARRIQGEIREFDDELRGVRGLIVRSYELILWVMLAIGILSALWSLIFGFRLLGAVETLVQTVAIVGLGFVALDIRDRLK